MSFGIGFVRGRHILLPWIASRRFELLIVAMGVVLLSISLPYTIGAALSASVYSDRDRLNRGELQDAVSLRHLEGTLTTAFTWAGLADDLTDAALVDLNLAVLDKTGSSLGGVDVDHAIDHLETSLSRSPGDGLTWALLANTVWQYGSKAEAARLIKMSFLTARFDPALLAWRCNTGLGLYDYLDSEERELLADQIRLAWRWAPNQLLDITLASQRLIEVRAAVAIDAAALVEFDKKFGDRVKGRS